MSSRAASQPCLHPLATHALITRRPLRCRLTPASIVLPESYKRNDYSPVGVRRAQSCLTLRPWQPVCPSPHHLLLRLRHPWGRGVWGRARLIMHSPISICGELRCCRRDAHFYIFRVASGYESPLLSAAPWARREEREKPTQSASAGAQTPSRHSKGWTKVSNLTSPKASLFITLSPLFPMLCFALLVSPCATLI